MTDSISVGADQNHMEPHHASSRVKVIHSWCRCSRQGRYLWPGWQQQLSSSTEQQRHLQCRGINSAGGSLGISQT